MSKFSTFLSVCTMCFFLSWVAPSGGVAIKPHHPKLAVMSWSVREAPDLDVDLGQ